YTPGESNGYPGGLKYALGAEAYARAQAALTNAQTATNANLAPYADHYFQYDSSQRVTRHDVAAAGSSGGTGLGTYSYSFTTSTNSDGYNNWKYKTVETLPSGLQNIVYANAYGETMLKVFVDAASNKWISYFQYDSAGRMIFAANPSAVSGYNDTYADLVHY